MRIIVLADTHVRRGSSRRLPDAVYDALVTADAILHAGDVVTGTLLDELSGFAPVHAVLGNNDHELFGVLPESIRVEFDGVPIAMVHDSGLAPGREQRMARRFPDAAVVVFGHSHAPLDTLGLGPQRLFNPGSPTERRAQPRHSYGELIVDGGELVGHRVVPVET